MVVQPALSSYHAESVAMVKCIEQLLKDKDFTTSNATVGIFTDSHGLYDHLMKLKRQDVPVEVHTQNLIEQLIKLGETNPEGVTIHWILSHRGIGDNERQMNKPRKDTSLKRLQLYHSRGNGSKQT